MKAPDILYLDEDVVKNPSNAMLGKPYEYIRKDALLEWLIKGVEMSEICHSEYGDACAQAYQAVIDKINHF